LTTGSAESVGTNVAPIQNPIQRSVGGTDDGAAMKAACAGHKNIFKKARTKKSGSDKMEDCDASRPFAKQEQQGGEEEESSESKSQWSLLAR